MVLDSLRAPGGIGGTARPTPPRSGLRGAPWSAVVVAAVVVVVVVVVVVFALSLWLSLVVVSSNIVTMVSFQKFMFVFAA